MPSSAAYARALRATRIASGCCQQCGLDRGDDGTTTFCRRCANIHARRQRLRLGLSAVPAIQQWERLRPGPRQTVGVMVTRDEAAEWKHFCATQGMSLSAALRTGLRQLIELTDEHEEWRDDGEAA